MRRLVFPFLILCLVASVAFGQRATIPMPVLVTKNGRHQLMVDGKPYFILGGQIHNSSTWAATMPGVWTAARQLHLNTLEAPLYWESIEPIENKFDFSSIDMLLTQARQNKVRLVLLWFATWKNGSNHYVPTWMKKDATRFPNIVNKKGGPVDSPSPLADAALQNDIKAFRAVMRYLKQVDPQHTVIMVQVENEPGAWDTPRDYSALAQQQFKAPVPSALLQPKVLKAVKTTGAKSGNWEDVFGDNADEYFHAWHVASYIGKVAAAGKAEYNLPLYVNAALRDPLSDPKPPSYESGGPTDNVLTIWQAAAPAIDLLAPDIYLTGSERIMKVIELYARPDNALFVPEAGLEKEKAKYLYQTLAAGGIGFSPFGIDADGPEAATTADRLMPFGYDYKVAAPMASELAVWANAGKITSVVEREDHADQIIDLGNWQAVVSFGRANRNVMQHDTIPTGRLLMVKLGTDEFLAMGALCHITFKGLGANKGKAWQYVKVEEGIYQNGTFKPLRILNGDETDWGGPSILQETKLLRISLVAR